MGVVRFEELRVWQAAKCLCDEIGALIQRPSLQNDDAIKNQLNAATLSTMANIAEGFMRGGSKEFAQFVRIAAGSKRVSGISCVGHSMRSSYAPQTEKPA